MQDDRQTTAALPRFRRGRLQRAPGANGYRVATFVDVIVRHGGVMGGIALLCLFTPGALVALEAGLRDCLLQPFRYAAGLLALLVFFVLWSRQGLKTPLRQSQWVAYLLFISIVEEFGFRLILPALLWDTSGWLVANLVSNLVFAALHYVTLRWQLKNCVVTFLGGMGLSQLMTGGDFVLVVMVHWLGTFLNTPFPPGRAR